MDWGFFPHSSSFFTNQGLALLTFNFSYNGVDEANPTEFTRLDLFSQNTVTRELREIHFVVEWVKKHGDDYGLDTVNINIMGHSRGAAHAISYAAFDKSIKNVVALAPVSNYQSMFQHTNIEEWKEKGYINIPNTRTGQEMPLNYGYWEDLVLNEERLDILESASDLECGLLLIHGTEDKSVNISHSIAIYNKCGHSILIKIDGADHTFNAVHPWQGAFTPQAEEALQNAVEFLVDEEDEDEQSVTD
jgi:pimeloyl-ACP methyl ester carboxylesterase